MGRGTGMKIVYGKILRSSLCHIGCLSILLLLLLAGCSNGFWSEIEKKKERDDKIPKIYWPDSGSTPRRIQRANLDGSEAETVVTIASGTANPYAIAVDPTNKKIYWTDSGDDIIRRADLDGSNVEDLITTGLNAPYGLAVAPQLGYLFWTDSTNDTVYRSSLKPPTLNAADYAIITNASDGVEAPMGIAVDVDRKKIFWTEIGTTKRIGNADLNGSNVDYNTTAYLQDPIDIALDTTNSVVYLVDLTKVEIYTYDYTFSVADVLIDTNLQAPIGIVLDLDNEQMYWTDVTNNKIYRGPLNGGTGDTTDYELPVTGLFDPRGIAIY